MTKKQKKILDEDQVFVSLKERYFNLLKREKIGTTTELTKTIDKLEEAIIKRREELLNGKQS